MKRHPTALLAMLGLCALLENSALPGWAKAVPAHPIDLNTAGVVELMQLPGIGRSRAEAILTARQLHPFGSTQDLLKVPGIGVKRLESLAPHIRVAAGTSADAPDPASPPTSSKPAAGRR